MAAAEDASTPNAGAQDARQADRPLSVAAQAPTATAGASARFLPFLRWPLMRFRDSVDLTEPDGGLREHVENAVHGLRLQRYWWAACALEEEVSRSNNRPFTVVDLGCERGWMKRFTAPRPTMEWIGVDGSAGHPSLAASRYDRVYEANFDDRLPLPDGVADAVISLHVFEHLRDPQFAAMEVARILKPGGCFLAGSPTAPSPVSWIRTRMLEARDRRGENHRWGHVRKMSPAVWHHYCTRAGLEVEFVTGSHLIRRSGSRLEDRKWWVRLNQLWGGLVPSMGQEVYLRARKPLAGVAPRPRRLQRAWLRIDWMAPLAALVGLGVLIATTIDHGSRPAIHEVMSRIQDGNDDFALAASGRSVPPVGADAFEVITEVDAIPEAFARRRQLGRDLHLIVDLDDADLIATSAFAGELQVADRWREGSRDYLLLSQANGSPRLVDLLRDGR